MNKSVQTKELTAGLKARPLPHREKVKFPLLFADIYMERTVNPNSKMKGVN